MTQLEALNLKDVKVYGKFGEQEWNGISDNVEKEGVIPYVAMEGKSSLLYLVLPDKLEAISERAFSNCINISGSLMIPEGVTRIGYSAFAFCRGIKGDLSLPNTLKYIASSAFHSCDFTCQLILPINLQYIGANAFEYNNGFYGNLSLQDNLTYIGACAFNSCTNLRGDLKYHKN